MKPRIYLYKITFSGRPEYYFGVHKEKKFEEEYWGSPVSHKDYWDLYEPVKEIIEYFEYSEEGWCKALDKEKLVIQDNWGNPLCLNDNCGGQISLRARSKGGVNCLLRRNFDPSLRERYEATALENLTRIHHRRQSDPEYDKEFRESSRRGGLAGSSIQQNRRKIDPEYDKKFKEKALKGSLNAAEKIRGSIWITNGFLSKRVEKSTDMPEGWYLGRAPKTR